MRSPLWSAIKTFTATIALGCVGGSFWISRLDPGGDLTERWIEFGRHLYKVACVLGVIAFVYAYSKRDEQDAH